MKVVGFYHVLLKNHWREIVREQLDCMVGSGLYDYADKIFVGCNGSHDQYCELQIIFSHKIKFDVFWHGDDVLKYEFPTLDIMKGICDRSAEKISCFYIHTKGASFDRSHERGYNGGNYWRGYMNFYNIKKWKEALNKIERGCDVVGVKLRNDKSTGNPHAHTHFSGNFFWTHSDYVKKLPAIESLNKADRIQAEFWHGKAKPKTFSMCQDWVDYNTKGIWKDPPLIEQRNIIHTLCWNTFDQVEKAVTDLYARNDKKDFIHVLVDLEFPLIYGDIIPENIEQAKAENSNSLKFLAEKFGSIYFKCKNIGVSQNWTQVAKFMKITEHDILICADPDERVKTDNWVKALSDIMRYNQRYGWLSLTMPEHLEIINNTNHKEYLYYGIRVWEIIGNLNWAQGAMSGKLIVQMGGEIPYPEHYEIYGGIETAVRKEMKKYGYVWGMLPDFIVEHTNEVPLLREWKDLIIHGIKRFGQMSFEKFLSMKKEKVL